MSASDAAGPWPIACFVGDFNTGKSTLINALLREPILRSDRQESRSLPALVWRGGGPTAGFGAATTAGEIHRKSLSQFHGLRYDESNTAGYVVATVQTLACPFARLVLADTPGTSSDSGMASAPEFNSTQNGLMVVVTDIEYWSSKHNLELIANYHESFEGAVLVVANKADHLNILDIDKVQKKATQRMEDFGITPAPRFFTLSARLEMLRGDRDDEYRRRTKPTVRAHCDAAFDAFRVALYEFEAASLPAVERDEASLLDNSMARDVIAAAAQDAAHAV